MRGENMAPGETEFCLKWNNFRPSVLDTFETCYDEEEFIDVTLAAEGQYIRAHRVFLSACSTYFRSIFKNIPSAQHPVIVLKDVDFKELQMLVTFIYHGEILVKQRHIKGLLRLAKSLNIKGLADADVSNDPNKDCHDQNASMDREDLPEQMPIVPEVPQYPYNLPQQNAYPPQCPPMIPLDTTTKRSAAKAMHPKKNKIPRNQSPPRQPGRPSSRGTPAGSPSRRPSPSPRDFHHSPQMPPQMNVTPGSSGGSPSTSEEEAKVVNLSVNNGHDHLSAEDSPPPVIAKMEVEEETERNSPNGPTENRDENHEQKHPSEEAGKPMEISSLSHLALGQYRYPLPAQEGFAGPSGIMPSGGPTESEWRHNNLAQAMAEQDTPPGSHPVFNELYGVGVGDGEIGGGNSGTSIGGKKAVPTPCPVCRKVLSNAYNMRVHLETHQHNVSYKCIVCGIITRTRDTMRKHCSHVHKLRSVQLKNSFKKISGESKFKSPSGSPSKPPFAGLETLSSLLTPKTEPGTSIIPPTSAALNFSKGFKIDSIVNKLTQKQ